MCSPLLPCRRNDLARVRRPDRTFRKLQPMVDVSYKLWFDPHVINYVTFEHSKPMTNCPDRCEIVFVLIIPFLFETHSARPFVRPYDTYVVGSSKNKTGGLSNNSKAIDRRFRCPPDKLPHRVNFERINWSVFRTLSIYGKKSELIFPTGEKKFIID